MKATANRFTQAALQAARVMAVTSRPVTVKRVNRVWIITAKHSTNG